MARADYSIYGETKMNAAGFNSTLSKMESAATRGLAVIGSAVAGAVTAVAGIGVSYNAQVEQLQTSFEVMTGSAEEAAGVIENLKKVGAETPFELTDLAETTQLLMNYGFSAEEAQDRLMMLGDISQGSAEKMNRIATAYGQMSSAGKVSLEDIKQMIEAGFNPLQEISESTGESMASLYDRISKGTISIDEITASMQRSTSEGGKYFQSMEKQSQTFSGQLSTLKDNALSVVGALSSGLSKSLTESVLPDMNGWLEQIRDATEANGIQGAISAVSTIIPQIISNISTQLPSLITMGVDIITSVVNGIISAIPSLVEAAISGFSALLNALGSNLPLIIDKVVEIIPQIIQALTDNIPTLIQGAIQFFSSIAQAVPQAITALSTQLPTIITSITSFLTTQIPVILQAAINLFSGILQSLPTVISSLTAALPELINTVTSFLVENFPLILDAAIQLFEALIDALPTIIDSLIENLPEIIKSIVNFLMSSLPQILNAAIDLFNAIITAIPEILPQLALRMPDILMAIVSGLMQSIPKISQTALDLFMQLVFAIPEMLFELGKKLPEIGSKILGELIKIPAKVFNVGKDIITGIWDGIKSMLGWIGEKIGGFVDDVVGFFTDGFDIGSPSKVLSKEVGRWLPPGITVGVEDAMPKAERSLQNMVDDMIGRARGSVAAMQSKMAGYTPHFEEYEGHGSQQDTGESLTIEVPVNVDGREIARTTAKYFGPRLAWEG